jgi:hypothetical protein
MKFGVGVLIKSCQGIMGFLKIGSVTAIVKLRTKVNYFLYYPYLLADYFCGNLIEDSA